MQTGQDKQMTQPRFIYFIIPIRKVKLTKKPKNSVDCVTV